jgi:hypothetical protein
MKHLSSPNSALFIAGVCALVTEFPRLCGINSFLALFNTVIFLLNSKLFSWLLNPFHLTTLMNLPKLREITMHILPVSSVNRIRKFYFAPPSATAVQLTG